MVRRYIFFGSVVLTIWSTINEKRDHTRYIYLYTHRQKVEVIEMKNEKKYILVLLVM